MNKLLKNKKGSALVEYGLLIAGVALVGAAAISIFGHKTGDLIASTAMVLPGAHDDDNAPIVSGKLIETTAENGAIVLGMQAIENATETERLGNNILGAANNSWTSTAGGGTFGSSIVLEAN